ncbi:MAG: glucosaminidase domain-containing protein [Bacteroidetes bacterium]|nr:glucosaminidase domain-containing protein [Bacteroidota bacterium]
MKRGLLLCVFILSHVFVIQIGAGKISETGNIIDNQSLHSRFVSLSFKAYDVSSISASLIEVHFSRPDQDVFTSSAAILAEGKLTKGRLISFLWDHHPGLDVSYVERLVDLYIRLSNRAGVNHDIAFVQMCHETGFLKFRGDVKPDQNNFCGLGAVGNHNPGQSFPSVEAGVLAHISHLKAYASTEPIDAGVESRARFIVRGSATTFHDLTGKWATDPHYGDKIAYLLNLACSGSFVAKQKSTNRFSG